jgi:hypothetical protein
MGMDKVTFGWEIRRCPHSLQNLALSGFSNSHFGHFTVDAFQSDEKVILKLNEDGSFGFE